MMNTENMTTQNEMSIAFSALSSNESFARTVIAAFIAPLNPTLSELMEIKTAVSEAVTNAIVHGYEGGGYNMFVCMGCRKLHTSDNTCIIEIEVADAGVGIPNISQALEPLYTSKPEQERSGMGFAVMESFMDSVEVTSIPGSSTKIVMTKELTLG